MAKLIQPFNPANHNPDAVGGDGKLPIGTHKVIAFANEVKATKQNTGGFLKYSLRIVEGEFAGATGADRFNLYNQNEMTVRIAHDALAQMVRAVGHQGQFDDADVLLNRPFMIEVVPQSNNPDYNEVNRRFACQANSQQQQGFNQQSQQQQSPPQQNEPAQQWGQQAQGGGQQPAQQQSPQNTPFGSPGAQFQQPAQQQAQQPQNTQQPQGGFGGGAGWGN